jgi:hypothetical protein
MSLGQLLSCQDWPPVWPLCIHKAKVLACPLTQVSVRQQRKPILGSEYCYEEATAYFISWCQQANGYLLVLVYTGKSVACFLDRCVQVTDCGLTKPWGSVRQRTWCVPP